jgi:hypothetical protein
MSLDSKPGPFLLCESPSRQYSLEGDGGVRDMIRERVGSRLEEDMSLARG